MDNNESGQIRRPRWFELMRGCMPRRALTALLAFFWVQGGAALAQTQPYPGPQPNQPPQPTSTSAGAPIELKYYAPGGLQVTKLIGLLDNSINTSADINNQSFPCSDTTTPTHLGNASNTHASTVPYDVWYPSTLGHDGLSHPIVVFGGGFNPPAGAPLPASLPAGATAGNTLPQLVTADNPSAYDYFLRHLASWGFVVIASQSGEPAPGLQDICAAEYLIGLNTSPAPLLMVNEAAAIGPANLNGISYDPSSGTVSAAPQPVLIPEIVPVAATDGQGRDQTFVFSIPDPDDPAYPIPQYSYAVSSVPSTYSIQNPFYGALNTTQIAMVGHSEGATGALNAYIDGVNIVNNVPTHLFKTLVSVEPPVEEWCKSSAIVQLLDLSLPSLVIPEAPDATCGSTARVSSGSVFFVNGTLDWVVSPSWQLFQPCVDAQGNSHENSSYCMYSDIPTTTNVAKAWATLEAANHQDIMGQPWCINFTNRNQAQPSDAQYGVNDAAIAYWGGSNPWELVIPYYANILAGPASPVPCGSDYSGDQTLNPNFDNPSYGGAFGYLGYPTAWLMDQLQADGYAHEAFVSGSGEIFTETANWTNQTSNIVQ